MSDTIYFTPGDCCCEPTCCAPCDVGDTVTAAISGLTSGGCVPLGAPDSSTWLKATADGINAMWSATANEVDSWVFASAFNEIGSQACGWGNGDCSGEDSTCSPTGEGETGVIFGIVITCDAGLFTVTYSISWGGFDPSARWAATGTGNFGEAIALVEDPLGTNCPGILTGGVVTLGVPE